MAGSDGGRSFLDDLKRRQVVRVAVVYIGAGFVVLEGADLLGGAFQLPQVFLTAVGVLVVLGFPLAVALAWAFEITPEGVKRTEEALPPPEPSFLSSRVLKNTLNRLLVSIPL